MGHGDDIGLRGHHLLAGGACSLDATSGSNRQVPRLSDDPHRAWCPDAGWITTKRGLAGESRFLLLAAKHWIGEQEIAAKPDSLNWVHWLRCRDIGGHTETSSQSERAPRVSEPRLNGIWPGGSNDKLFFLKQALAGCACL